MAEGHCLCGQLKFQTTGEPAWVMYCHCASCRRHTASPVTCYVNFESSNVAFSGDRSTFASSPGVKRSFCAQCGTPVAYETEKRPEEIDLYLNVFDEPERFTPQKHVYYDEHISWFDVRDDLPRE
ncbi:MAG: GFA family protein [Gammaproteobacteria bacterium]|nr:GFA family protein [Gammaproteobacteria bacterium]